MEVQSFFKRRRIPSNLCARMFAGQPQTGDFAARQGDRNPQGDVGAQDEQAEQDAADKQRAEDDRDPRINRREDQDGSEDYC